jgi:hypothetical protein
MNTATDIQLKHALAKMLPEKVYMNTNGGQMYHRLDGEPQPKVLDTELLHLCWLAEKAISGKEQYLTWEDILSHTGGLSATWQQRTIALSRTLDIKIV